MFRMLPIIILSFLLTNCAYLQRGTVENPYDGYTGRQLAQISGSELCRTITDESYKRSNNVMQYLLNRGYKDCSESTIYCISYLSQTPGTDAYTNCKIQRDQYNLNMAQYNLNARQVEQQNNFQNNIISKIDRLK